MSRVLDYDHLTKDDVAWMRARGWGHKIPKNVSRRLRNAKPAAEIEVEVEPDDDELTEDESTEEDSDEGYSEEDYETWPKADLLEEITSRNEGRDHDDLIAGDKNMNKADLITLLVGDDE